MKNIKHPTKEHNRLIYYLCLFNLIFVTFACQQKGVEIYFYLLQIH